MKSRISVVIVNYNGRHLLGDCLAGLEAQTCRPNEVIVVDNGSDDDSVAFIHRTYPWVGVIEARRNLGFAAGNNVGIRASAGDIVVLLNNDTLPGPGFIEAITSPLEYERGLSAVAGVLVFQVNRDRIASAGIDVHADGLALDHRLGEYWRSLPQRFSVFGPSAGAAAYRRSVLVNTGMFPEAFFLYLEDADLAWRMRLLGDVTVGIRGAWVQHIYSASAREGSPLKDYYLARNRAWTLVRCWPRSLWLRFGWSVVRYEILALAHALISRRWQSVSGRVAGWRAVWSLRKDRKSIQDSARVSGSELLYWVRPATSVRETMRARSEVRILSSGFDPGSHQAE